MSKTIRTYDDLLAHQEYLRELFAAQKQVIREDIREIKAEFSPLTNIVRIASKFFTRSKDHSLIVNGASSLVDRALKKIVLPRVGWIGRMVLPFMARNISSHLVAENKDTLFDKLTAVLTHKKKKHQY
ncbi:MAG: hypothetical protein ABUT20_03465 [Bacteroidota bacterium]